MASIFPCFTVTAKYHSIIFSSSRPSFLVKPTSQFHSLWSHASLVLNSNASLSKVARQNSGFFVPSLVVRASIDVSIAAIRPGGAVESDKLPEDVRKRAMDAVDACGGRVTIGDVAIKAGLKLNEAQKALQALAADTSGFLEVSDEGDVLYVLPKDYRSKLAAKSFRMKVEPFVEKAKSAAEYLVKVSFGTALVASIVIVCTAIIALLASGCDGDNFPFGNCGTGIHGQRMQVEDVGMNFIESVFSFVFGDGDPNQGSEEERWKLIGEYIASNGGVVTAEELAPYLDLETANDTGDDSYILPVLLQFDGQPEVDEEGNILYQFPSLQRTASPQRSGRQKYVGRKWADWVGGIEKFFTEKKLQFSKASTPQRAMVIVLGGLNLFGVVILGTMLKNIAVKPSGFIAFVSFIFPLLQIYAAAFFAIPFVRRFLVHKRNDEIEQRNSAREQRARALELPDLSLKQKLLSARNMAQRTFIGQERIVYSSDKDLFELDYEAQEWDQRFQDIEKSD